MRRSGILLPIFSLHGSYGIGTLGSAAYEFTDFLSRSGQYYWQILPLNPTSYGNSPYQSPSVFAGNPYFIDPDFLVRDGLLSQKDTEVLKSENTGKIDYGELYSLRLPLLKKAAENLSFASWLKYPSWGPTREHLLSYFSSHTINTCPFHSLSSATFFTFSCLFVGDFAI